MTYWPYSTYPPPNKKYPSYQTFAAGAMFNGRESS